MQRASKHLVMVYKKQPTHLRIVEIHHIWQKTSNIYTSTPSMAKKMASKQASDNIITALNFRPWPCVIYSFGLLLRRFGGFFDLGFLALFDLGFLQRNKN